MTPLKNVPNYREYARHLQSAVLSKRITTMKANRKTDPASPKTDPQRVKFDKLRSKYLAVQSKRDEVNSELAGKYGSGYKDDWLKASERKRVDLARAALEKAGDAMFEYIQTISPRDWSYGVPAYWVNEFLTYEDAVRPVNERLSEVPPMAYGATHPRT